MTILQLMDILSERAEDSSLGEEFWKASDTESKALASRLGVTPLQAVLLSICLRLGPRCVDFHDISRFLEISNIRSLEFSGDLDALIRARYLKFHDAKDEDSFDVPHNVVRAFKNDEIPEQPKKVGLDIHELFGRMEDLFDDLDDNAILPGELYNELNMLFRDNSQISFVKELNGLKITGQEEWMLLVIICHYLINKDDDSITFRQIEDIFKYKSDFIKAKNALKEGNHFLMNEGLIEHVCEDGTANTSRVHLTTKARSILLHEFHLNSAEANFAELTKPEKLSKKELFYSSSVGKQVEEVLSFLEPERYREIHERMKEGGFRSGFACLFYGGPGTGKTESVYQIARKTGRAILAVNVSDIKSKWVGDSEKNIKAVFDRYRMLVNCSETAPILLFNEADAIFGKRLDGATRAVDKMENGIQNIILEEMEKLDGILIATTNLNQNLDSAFERRFLYKIRFDLPDASVREKIWHVMIPSLSPKECQALALSYELSGGQMENVSRKFTINNILYGEKGTDRMDILRTYCSAEKIDAQKTGRIGF